MTKTVDARGLACPQPVILTRTALQESDAVVVIVDNETARQNVTQMAKITGCSVEAEVRADGIYLDIRKTSAAPATISAAALAAPAGGPMVLTIPSDALGRGDDELGQLLIRGFFHALGEVTPAPNTMIFFNSGVRLVVEGSPVLEDLQALCGRGIEILSCGTCLGYFGLKDKVAVGQVSNMYAIAETLLRAGKVINL